MQPLAISRATARRFVLGRQGLWPGRRWSGKDGTAAALHAVEAVQLDPLNIVARSQHITLASRVLNYRPAYLDDLMYHDREFFDYGNVLFVYPMRELPFWRMPMRRRANEGRWSAFAAAHTALLTEIRAELRTRGPLGNRDVAGHVRVNDYRGSKDSSLALF
ncbi:MAG: hypothetical protein NVS4B8_29800 [Herpetosiphon sp.]